MTSLLCSKSYSFRAAPRQLGETFDASIDGTDSFLKGKLTMVSRRAAHNRLQEYRGWRTTALLDWWRVGGVSEYSKTFVARVGRYIPPEFETEASWPCPAATHGLALCVEGKDTACHDICPGQRTPGFGGCFHAVGSVSEIGRHVFMCVDGGVLSTSRNIHHSCFVRGRNSVPEELCAPQKWHLSSPPPFHQPSPRLLLWRVQETLVGTRSNAACFSGVSRTIHSIRG